MTLNNQANKIDILAKEIFDQLVSWRRQIHSCPELGHQEYKTSKFIVEQLVKMDLQPEHIANNTGIVAIIRGELGSEPVVALRADMDALPIQEETLVDYKSLCPGLAHACGHDAHVAILLGVAKVLTDLKEGFSGCVKLIFQPCEEVPPGGAKEMIKAGVLESPDVEAIFSLHVNPHFPAGVIGVKEGVVMAAADVFELKITGSGGHGAAPHQTVDPIVIAAQLITAFQTVASRLTDPVEPVVLTIGQINGGTAPNIIPNTVEMRGTCRSLSQAMSKRLHSLIEELTSNIVKAYGADYQLNYCYGYPPVVNHKKAVDIVRKAGRKVVGAGKTLSVQSPSMGGEDFAYFCEQVPGAFFQLGVGDEKGENYPLHHPAFNLNEGGMLVGVKVMAMTALEALADFSREKRS